jgi:hypothetical protein
MMRSSAQGPDRLIAARFARDGSAERFEPPPRQRLPRHMRTEPGTPARVLQTLEDTPFQRLKSKGSQYSPQHETPQPLGHGQFSFQK